MGVVFFEDFRAGVGTVVGRGVVVGTGVALAEGVALGARVAAGRGSGVEVTGVEAAIPQR